MALTFLNIRHLRAFDEVATRRGISAAAQQVHLSQPAVTQAIAGIERQLGVTLFDRRAGGMFLTEAGALLHPRVQAMFAQLAAGAQAATRRRPALKGATPSPTFYLHSTSAQLRALIAIGASGSFSLAAQSLGISQPSVHRAGRDLESRAGVAFFTQTRRGVELSEAGDIFARAVQLAHASLQQGLDEVAHLAGRDTTRIRIGALPLPRSAILPRAIDRFLHAAPTVSVRNVDAPYNELLRALRHGELDLIIGALRDPIPAEDVAQEVLFEDPLAVIASPDHPLLTGAPPDTATLLAQPWIAPPLSTPSGGYLARWLGLEEGHSAVRVVTSSMVLTRALLLRGPYLAILSKSQIAQELARGELAALDLDLPGSHRPIGITLRRDWQPTATQLRFITALRKASAAASEAAPYSQNQ